LILKRFSDKYLGLPALVGADRSDCFLHFVERIIQRINGWKEKILSIGGKEILLKVVAQAIPVYAMSVFLIPKGFCKRMMDTIAQFWWGATIKKKDVWALEIFTHLILQCSQNRLGDS
jgi:hypothetical protein